MNSIKLLSRTKQDGSTKSLISKEKIPGILYGKNTNDEKITIDLKTISSLSKNKGFFSKIIPIELNGKKENVLTKEIQYHPVTDNIIHIDFMRVQENTIVTVEVPIDFLNREKSPGIKLGGVLNIVRRVVELRCNATKIPGILEFDLIRSEIGDSIKISNINLPDGVKPTITDRDFVIATLVPPTVEAEPEKTDSEEESEETEDTSDDKKTETTESKTESPENKTDNKKN